MMMPTDSNQMASQPQVAKAAPIAVKAMPANPMPMATAVAGPAVKAAPIMPQASAVASPILGPSANPSPLRNVNPVMRSMAPQASSIASMPANNGPMMRNPYGQ